MLPSIVSSSWLAEQLARPEVIVLDASTKSNVSGKKPEFEHCVIKGARYIDLNGKFSDQNAQFPNTLLPASQFEAEAQLLGINQESMVVVYDNLGIYNSARLWWMFKVMGHLNVAVLNGGLSAWVHEGYETVETHESSFDVGNFSASFNPAAIIHIDQVLENLEQRAFTVIDARSKGRFDGTAPEPREGTSSGHIPNSLNLPFDHVLENGFLKSDEALRAIFADLHIEDQPLVFSCGSGLTACITLLAAERVLPNQLSVYDGSWTEWASSEGTPIDRK